MKLPAIDRGKIVFLGQGVLNINSATWQDLVELFGLPYPQKYGPKENILKFFSGAGEISAFFHPEKEIVPQSQVLGLDLNLDRPMSLREIIAQYQRQPLISVIRSGESADEVEVKHFAVFDINMHAKVLLPGIEVEQISFVQEAQIRSCSCFDCKSIRETADLIAKKN